MTSAADRPAWRERSLVSSVRSSVRAVASDPLLRSAYSLMLNVVLTSILGIVFWIAAARIFTSETVGRDSALISTMIVIATICQLNLSSGLIRFLPVTNMKPRHVVTAAYAIAAGLSTMGGAAFVFLAPRVAHSYEFLAGDSSLCVLYVAAVTVWGVFALQDSVLTALRSATWVPVENAAYGAAKVALLPALLMLGGGHGVFVAWVVPIALLVAPVNFLIFSRVIPMHSRSAQELSPVERFGWRGVISFMAQDYAASILLAGTTTLVPVLVVALYGSIKGAYFYMPFTIVSAFDLLFMNVTRSLTVEGAIASERIPALARKTVMRFRYVLAAGIFVLLAAASLVLLPFGRAYAEAGTPVLRLLALASAFRAVIALYSALCRLDGRANRVLGVQAAVFVMTVGFTVLLGRRGSLPDVSLAWLVANGLVACAVTGHVVRVFRAGRSAKGNPEVTDERGWPHRGPVWRREGRRTERCVTRSPRS